MATDGRTNFGSMRVPATRVDWARLYVLEQNNATRARRSTAKCAGRVRHIVALTDVPLMC